MCPYAVEFVLLVIRAASGAQSLAETPRFPRRSCSLFRLYPSINILYRYTLH